MDLPLQEVYVNQSTTLVQIMTSYPATKQHIVRLSSVNTPGSLITIRDIAGHASRANPIIVSTTRDVKFLDGSDNNKHIYQIIQPYGFLTITPKTSSLWGILNTFAFPDLSQAANLIDLTTSSFTAKKSYLEYATISSALISTLSTDNLYISQNMSVGQSTIAHAGFYTCTLRTLNDMITSGTVYAGSTISSMFGNITSTLTVPYISTTNININGLIRFSGTPGDVGGTHTVIGERVYEGEKSELILFKGNDAVSFSGPDRVRVLATGGFQVDIADIITPINGRWFENAQPPSASITGALSVIANGNVGIRTTTPTEALDVNGNIQTNAVIVGSYYRGIQDAANRIQIVNGGGTYFNTISTNEPAFTFLYGVSANLASATGNQILATLDQNGQFVFKRLLLNGTGSFGLINLKGSGNETPIMFNDPTSINTATTNTGWFVGQTTSFLADNTTFGICRISANIPQAKGMWITSDGNVGIGIPNPRTHLVVNGAQYIKGQTTLAGMGLINGESLTNTQGAYTEWNHSDGNGETNYINVFKYGRWTWKRITSWTSLTDVNPTITNNALVDVMSLDSETGLIVSGSITASISGFINNLGNTLGRITGKYNSVPPFNSSQYITANWNASNNTFDSAVYGTCGIILDTNQPGSYISFLTSSTANIVPTERVRIIGNGNVGIGTTTPEHTLDVSGNICMTGNTMYIGSKATVSTSNLIRFYGTPADNDGYAHTVIGERVYEGTEQSELILFKGNDSVAATGPDRVRVLATGGFQVDIATNSAAWTTNSQPPSASIPGALCVVPSGKVGIGTTTPEEALDVIGNIRASLNVTAFSDVRAKENIVTIDSPLDKIMKMRGVYFTRKNGGERQVGVIAQEIEEVLPEVVLTDTTENKYKSVAYGNIVALLIEGMKAQQSTINSLLHMLNK